MNDRNPRTDPQPGDVLQGYYWRLTVTLRTDRRVLYTAEPIPRDGYTALENTTPNATDCTIETWRAWCTVNSAEPVANPQQPS